MEGGTEGDTKLEETFDKVLVGFWVGLLEGCREDGCDGVTVGLPLGLTVGPFDGTLLGDREGGEDRLHVGLWVGLGEGC